MLIHLTKKDNFDELIKEGDTIVDFFATWCGPCKMLAPELEELASEHPEIKVIKVDVDEFNELAGRFGIRAVPTLIVFNNGVATKQSMGYMDKNAVLGLVK
ncbi:MAG: thioredoxin [Erysipelotrichaceae bacterium]|mgnify:CR=1 FL=1|jgi:thioredoxin 1|nr:thioredoxin [Erysipelotrichaceae bacterium]